MKNSDQLISTARQKAKEVLLSCSRSAGFFASGLPGGYEAVWARDSMIASLGAGLFSEFKEPFRASLLTLAKHQSERGQIPNAVGSYNRERRSDVTYNSIDSSLWFIIGSYYYRNAYKDNLTFKSLENSVKQAALWLSYQDPNEDGLPTQLPTTDWQDIFPHKYGRTINTQSLYYKILLLTKRKKEAAKLKATVNGRIRKYLSLYDQRRGYYLPWIWKSHGPIREEGYWFDTLGNLLAIITGLATPQIAKSILSYIDRQKINRPFPCLAIYPPLKRSDKEWQDYFETAESKTPYHYLNGGIWPFIGGFYVAALVKEKQYRKAKQELQKLALANQVNQSQKEKLFPEWLHGKTGRITGGANGYQAWSAGMFLFADQSLKNKKVPFFD